MSGRVFTGKKADRKGRERGRETRMQKGEKGRKVKRGK